MPVPGTAPAPAVPQEQVIGRVAHYYSHLGVAVVEVTGAPLRVGDRIHIKGHTTDFTQTAESMEVEHNRVDVVNPGQSCGLRVVNHAREHDVVYRAAPGG